VKMSGGISPSGQDYSDFGPCEVEEELPHFLDRLNQWREIEHSSSPRAYAYDPHRGHCVYDRGHKYIRIVLVTPSLPEMSDKAYGFVRLSDGALLKAQTWEGPYLGKGCVRGYIFDQDVTIACEFYGVRYASKLHTWGNLMRM